MLSFNSRITNYDSTLLLSSGRKYLYPTLKIYNLGKSAVCRNIYTDLGGPEGGGAFSSPFYRLQKENISLALLTQIP